jgi:hypothetical protein
MSSRNFELILKIVGSPPLWRHREIDVARNFQQLGTRYNVGALNSLSHFSFSTKLVDNLTA